MKMIANLIALNRLIASLICFSFIIYLPAHVFSAEATLTAADLKSGSQYRSEASRYDAAIRSIAGIVTMKLDTPVELRRALDILKRARPNLKFHRSKLVSLALSDPSFSNAVKRRLPDKQTAEAFARELQANRKLVLKLDGAESLKTRLRQSDASDAAILRRAAEKLKTAAEKFRKTSQRKAPVLNSTTDLNLIQAAFREPDSSRRANDSLSIAPQDNVRAEDLFTEDHTIALAVTAAVMVAIIVGSALIRNIFTEEGRDAIADCLERNDARFERCVSDIGDPGLGGLLNPFYLAALALCEADWLARAAACLLAS